MRKLWSWEDEGFHVHSPILGNTLSGSRGPGGPPGLQQSFLGSDAHSASGQSGRRKSHSHHPGLPSLKSSQGWVNTYVGQKELWASHILEKRTRPEWAPSPLSGEGAPSQSMRGWGAGGQSRRLEAGTYLGIVLRSGEEGQLIGRGEVGSNLLHLPKTLPFPPLGPPVLEPDLQDRAVVTGVRPGAGGPAFGQCQPFP